MKELNLSNCSIDSDGACKLASSIGTDLIIIKLKQLSYELVSDKLLIILLYENIGQKIPKVHYQLYRYMNKYIYMGR